MINSSTGRIVQALRTVIREAPPGARLPSTRRLVTEYAASPVTVQKALRLLDAEGLIESRPGVGCFVRAPLSARPPDHTWQTAALGAPRATLPKVAGALRTAPTDTQALHSGYPDPDLLPERLVRAALTRAARGASATARPAASGLHELRAWFASEIAGATSAGLPGPTANDVVVVPGSQSGLNSVFRALVPPGGSLLVESPTYWGAILAAHQAGARLVPVASDADGPDPELLDRSLRETGARAFYVQPNFANPTGAQWSSERTTAVLDVVREHGAFLVEDDWAHDFGIDTDARPMVARDASGHVVYLRSLTKSVSPSIRVGAVVARGPVLERLLADRSADSLYVSGLLQQAALEVLTDPGWRAHLRRLRPRLRERRDHLVDSLRRHAPALHVEQVPRGGLHLWARLPHSTDVDRLTRDCEDNGVWVASGHEWFPAELSGLFLRLNFTGPDPLGFPAAARTIDAALASQGARAG